jgi:hypothetical protein
MSVIHAQRPLATGIDTAVQALKKAQDRLGGAALEIARQGTSSEASTTKEAPRPKSPAVTPPNPGPPGGANPADLAQIMVARASSPPPPDLLNAMVTQRIATTEVAANVKTVQAFDAMLDELPRMKQSSKAY